MYVLEILGDAHPLDDVALETILLAENREVGGRDVEQLVGRAPCLWGRLERRHRRYAERASAGRGDNFRAVWKPLAESRYSD